VLLQPMLDLCALRSVGWRSTSRSHDPDKDEPENEETP
jgi:hypothetical protein